MRSRKSKTAAYIALSVTGTALALVPPVSATAAGVTQAAKVLSIAYTSSAHPGKSYTNPDPETDLPLGSTGSKVLNTNRVYLTYDLRPYLDRHVLGATLFAHDATAANCATQAVDVWTTDPPGKTISWEEAPRDLDQVASLAFSPDCPSSFVHGDMTAAIIDAVARGDTTISIELRVPMAHELDLNYAVTFDSSAIQLEVNVNDAPATPSALAVDGIGCGTTEAGLYTQLTPMLTASAGDAQQADTLTSTFAIWPVDHPDQHTQLPGSAIVGRGPVQLKIPNGLLSDGVSYAWQVRTSDGTDTSAWSDVCDFEVHVTQPAIAPTITSANYPPEQLAPVGVPGTFTFEPNGATGVVAYQYSWIDEFGVPSATNPYTDPTIVRAGPDGSATVTLSPPSYLFERLYVRSFDEAFLSSPEAYYEFRMPYNAPSVEQSTNNPAYGAPFTLALTMNANAGTVDSYIIRIDSGTPQTVSANANGSATVSVSVPHIGNYQITVSSHATSGLVSQATTVRGSVQPAVPTVSSTTYPESGVGGGVGIIGTFDLSIPTADVAYYLYMFDDDSNQVYSVNADANGNAEVTWTPDASGPHTLDVVAYQADGSSSDDYTYNFTVAGG